MIGATALALVLTGCGAEARTPIGLRSTVSTADPTLRVSDVIVDGALPSRIRDRIGEVALVRMDARTQEFDLPVVALMSRMRGRVPLLGCYLPANVAGVVHVRLQIDPDRSALPPRRDPAGVKPDDVLQLTTSEGPVRVARRVMAIQSARSGQRLFVRTDDGALLSVRFEGAAR